ncbi:PAS domain-containing protein [Limnoglobus roseus]|uniref:PAS domain-containing protein n=1 Tax=Limnoglobus roseus TaxID=2598579 RepID=UPI0021BCDE57|nr:PAS domain-containing protein [Limnoglobus roseus]
MITTTNLSAVLTTAELSRRPSRPPDHFAEARALSELAKTLADDPRGLLRRLSELAKELCGAESAGVSILEPSGDTFRWHAIAGDFAPNIGGTIARDASPCGVVLERDSALMFSYPERHFPYPNAVEPPIVESVLIPFHSGGKPVGTVWVIAHSPERRFDPEDARLLGSLSRFAAAAWQTVTALDAAEAAKAESDRRVEERTAEVRAGEEKYRVLFNSIDEGFCIIDVLFDGEVAVDYRFVEVNAAFADQTGFRNAVGKRIRELAPALEAHWFEVYGRVAKTCESVRFESRAKELGRWYDVYAFKVDGGAHVGVLFRDVTERKRSEEELRLRERAIRAASQGLVITDVGRPDNPLIYVSAGFERVTGYPAAEVLGRNCRFLQGPDSDPATVFVLREAIRASRAATVELLNYRKDGTPFWNEVSLSPVVEAGRVTHFVGVITDVTDRRRIIERLRDQEELLRETAQMTHVGGWSFDPSTGASDWTEETFLIHNLAPGGTAENMGQGLTRFPGDDGKRIAEAVRAACERGTPYDLELDFVAADGQKKRVRAICRPVVAEGKVVRVRGSLQDVTARHALEERLRRSQKMEAFGQLAGGVAHDFNNMLQVINGYAELAIDRLAAEHEVSGLLREIGRAGERSATLTRQLLAFARQEIVAPRVLDVNAAAWDTTGMLRRLIGENIRLVTDFGSGVWPVLADPGQLEQVLINLAVNARDAMPDGGALTISSRNETVTGDGEVPPGQYAVLSVADTGTGMPPEVQTRVFEPFFTTKGVGKGTGLGLATVYGIVQQAGGHVRVRSKMNEGSTFEVLLPRTNDPKAATATKSGGKLPRGTETVLVVEDETAVRGLVKLVLSGCGYKVLVAGDGVAAERVAAEHAGPIHLVLSDVVMPGAGGRAVAAGVSAKHPEARVVFMSGYTDDAVVRHGVSAEVPFLQKPFTPEVLATKVRQVLDGSR